ncbi:hypothetical protein BJ944DRAFT_262263 [Cunninghamella echinulata]|nr:hypothetical protein BJ944DRAFT_262263 [Cunninghamella echinulata]
MCQFCGVDPAFASFFDKDSSADKNAATTTAGSHESLNFFRLKPDHPRYTKLTTPQLTTFASKLSSTSKVLVPHQGEVFEKAAQRWSKQAIRTPLAIIQVTCAEDILKAITLATSHEIEFVVKGGGHSPSGASNIENGLVIDLSLMRQVSVKPEEKLAIVDGGCLFGDVLKATAEYGLCAVGGTTSHVGVGGLSLSGGYGYLTGEYGLAVDNIVGAQVVTSDGQILWVNENEHSDLFWGIRGAGNRLAVVVKFIFQLHPIRQVWGGVIKYKINDQLPTLITAINEWYDKKDVKASIGMVLDKDAIILFPFYNGSQEEAEKNFATLLQLEDNTLIIEKDVSVMPFWKINTLSDHPGAFSGAFIEFASANIAPPLQVDHIQSIIDAFKQFSTNLFPTNDCGTGCYILLIQPNGIRQHQPTDMAFPHRDDHFDVGCLTTWQQPDQAQGVKTWLHQTLQPLICSKGDSNRLYSNHSDFKGPASKEFGINYNRIKELKEKWDPNDVFRSLL